jgi:hypothetical protein
MPGVYLNFALHARSLPFMNIFCSMPGVLMILRNIQISSELFHPTKIKIELTSFENFENELFTIFIKKTLRHLN